MNIIELLLYVLLNIGKLKVTTEGISERNHFVYNSIKQYNMLRVEQASNCDNPEYARLVIVMGGGYPKSLDPDSHAFQTVIHLHSEVYISAYEVFS